MQRRWLFCIWILAALLVTVSVDTRPDPPALDPHFAATKISVPNESPILVPNTAGNHGAHIRLQFRAQETILTGDAEPENPASFLTQSGQAADSSPPAPTARFL
jgi:hypothetical protein